MPPTRSSRRTELQSARLPLGSLRGALRRADRLLNLEDGLGLIEAEDKIYFRNVSQFVGSWGQSYATLLDLGSFFPLLSNSHERPLMRSGNSYMWS